MHDDSDVLERNAKLNDQVQKVASTYTRRKVVDSLLIIIIIMGAISVGIMFWVNFRIENKIENTDTRETQLICAHLDHPNIYLVCHDVGPPIKIGVNR